MRHFRRSRFEYFGPVSLSRKPKLCGACLRGSAGTTLIAAEKTGRSARLIEYDPAYCDTILRRFERVTGKQAIRLATGETFEDVEQHRGSVALSKGSAA
jgi:hypothetical protein